MSFKKGAEETPDSLIALNPYRIHFVNSLLDNVHGFIGVTKIEDEIERLPIFKRLQSISQLGLTNRIFPCALHNRYIHSLGVMYIADQMALRLGFDDDERQLIRLTGMLHDIGHYPFSHDVEGAYIGFFGPARYDSEKTLFDFAVKAINGVEELTNASNKLTFFLDGIKSSFHHENISAIVINNSTKIRALIRNHFVEGNQKFNKHSVDDTVNCIISDICAIITGNAQYISKFFSAKFSAMVQIMHSELDADRIDYLLRDATFSGASYGTFDVGILIQNLTYGEYAPNGEPPTLIVGVKPKGICCAEQLLINRYFAYNQVIFHKYSSILGCALQSIVMWLLSSDSAGYGYKLMLDMATCHEKDTRFMRFTDAALISQITNISAENYPCPEAIVALVACIKDYRSLNMTDEVIFSSIEPARIKRSFLEATLYLEATNQLAKKSLITDVYQYRSMRLTNHIPKESFEKLLEDSIANKVIEREMASAFRLDRLQDGLAVIDDNGPSLLIDSPRSLIHDIYNLRYCIFRSYAI